MGKIIVVEKLKQKKPLGRPGHRWENNTEMDHRDTGWVHVTGLEILWTGFNGGFCDKGQ